MTERSVAIVGATGAVGQDLMAVLASRNVPLRSLRLLASTRSVGERRTFAVSPCRSRCSDRNRFAAWT